MLIKHTNFFLIIDSGQGSTYKNTTVYLEYSIPTNFCLNFTSKKFFFNDNKYTNKTVFDPTPDKNT